MRHRPFVLIAGLAVMQACCGAPGDTGAHHAGEGRASATARWPLRTLAGETTTLGAVTGGRAAVVALWATWCDSCRREVPVLRRLHERSQVTGDFVVVAVAIGDDAREVQAFASRSGVAYRQLLDDEGRFGELGDRRVPTILVVDPAGHTVHEGRALDRPALDALAQVLARARNP